MSMVMNDEERPVQNLQDWEILQAKIFTKWVNQKLMSRHFPTIGNVQFDLGQEKHLRNLMYALTEKDPPVEKKKPSRMPVIKAQRIDELGKDLALVFDAGVVMKLKPSAENLYDGDFKDVMSLVWGIMQKFIKFDDDEDGENLSAKDALLRWLQFHTKSYGVEVTNLTKSFHNGMAFCALLHKFKPNSFNYEELDPANKKANLQLAIDKAEELFGIEKYLTPDDILKMDDKAMLVYCSEYYYAINEQAKRALAAKRISKLIAFTRDNDATKAHYEEQGQKLLEHLSASEELLNNIGVIDNTMAGAQERLANFDRYKADHKQAIISVLLDMEAEFKTLAMKLQNNNRPQFVPTDEKVVLATLTARKEAIISKESLEPQLHAELNRQRRLQQLNKRHETQSAKINQWISDKSAYLSGDFVVSTSGQARKQLKIFDSFVKEKAAMETESLSNLRNIGEDLTKEKYENSASVSERESSLAQSFASLDEEATKKRPILEDNLDRMLFKEKVELDAKVHGEIHQSLCNWATEKKAYLSAKENISDVQSSYVQLSSLDAFDQEKTDTVSGAVARLNTLGESIRAAKYETSFSQWVYEDPSTISSLESDIATRVEELSSLSAAKREVLDDDLAREQFKEKVELLVNNHASLFGVISEWANKKIEYLDTKEDVASSTTAKQQLSQLELYVKEKEGMAAGAVANLNSLGQEIQSAKYETSHSSWVYENPSAVQKLEADVDSLWNTLSTKHAQKKEILEDDLARELYAEQTRLMASRHTQLHDTLSSFAQTKSKQYHETITVSSIADAQFLLGQLSSLEEERKSTEASSVASFKKLGADVLSRKYSTSLSSYVFETPEDIKTKEGAIDSAFSALASDAATRNTSLEELLAKEQKKEELRLEFASLAATHTRTAADKIASIGTQEEQRTMHGFTLEEVEAYGNTLTADETDTRSSAESRKSAYTTVLDEMASLECSDNPYTTHTADTLASAWDEVESAIVERRSFYDAELQRHKDNDALCKSFADIVDPFEKKVNGLMEGVLSSTVDEETQLKEVVESLDSAPSLKLDFDAVKKMEEDISSRGILLNPHTVMSVDDVKLTWDNYMQVLESRKPYLEGVVAYRKYRGISPEQYEEMEQIFSMFDKDGSKTISEKELRSCLFSLGEERTKSEIHEFMVKHGPSGTLSFEPFRDLMVTLLGDTGTRDSTCESFQVITRGVAGVTEADLADLLSEEDISYVKSTAPASEEVAGAMDYTAWVESVFAR
eukprot:m.128521 g.128521  ORF g.128521 m.128521 type:complete len:1251 (+) comp13031_c0_seq1:71-3823(+)